MRLDAQEAGRVGEHGARVRLGKAFALQHFKEDFRMAAAHVGIRLAFFRLIAEIAPAFDHLLGRTAADAELKTATGNKVRSAASSAM